jgi:putative transposase
LGGRRVPVERPRGRTVTGDEIELAYAAFSNDDLLSQVGMEPMLAGVATRRRARVNEPVGDDLDAQARSTSRSSVSRRRKGYRQMPRFVAALARHLEAVPPACDAARVA